MKQYTYTILKVTKNCEFAFFKCSNGDYGVLEPQNCEVAEGDILQSIDKKTMPRCGVQFLALNGKTTVKVYVDDLDFKEGEYKHFNELVNRYL